VSTSSLATCQARTRRRLPRSGQARDRIHGSYRVRRPMALATMVFSGRPRGFRVEGDRRVGEGATRGRWCGGTTSHRLRESSWRRLAPAASRRRSEDSRSWYMPLVRLAVNWCCHHGHPPVCCQYRCCLSGDGFLARQRDERTPGGRRHRSWSPRSRERRPDRFGARGSRRAGLVIPSTRVSTEAKTGNRYGPT
jgi:hypothetical protein